MRSTSWFESTVRGMLLVVAGQCFDQVVRYPQGQDHNCR